MCDVPAGPNCSPPGSGGYPWVASGPFAQRLAEECVAAPAALRILAALAAQQTVEVSEIRFIADLIGLYAELLTQGGDRQGATATRRLAHLLAAVVIAPPPPAQQ